MRVTVEIPDELAAQMIAEGRDPARVALEALAVEGYRTQRLTEHQVRVMLGFETRMEVHALLAEHDVDLHYTLQHAQQDIAAANQLHAQRALQASHAE
ncbi:MAG: UPF0175 family protein [Acidobacteriaceae bacterium]|jgi:hypothetical protein